MRATAAQTTKKIESSSAVLLIEELHSTYAELADYLAELQQLLRQPRPNLARLITIRLRLAHLRLARGPLVDRVSRCLVGKLDGPEEAVVREMRSVHQQMLQAAAAHTGRWTLQAVEANWSEYRRITQQIAECWLERSKADQQLLYRLLKKQV